VKNLPSPVLLFSAWAGDGCTLLGLRGVVGDGWSGLTEYCLISNDPQRHFGMVLSLARPQSWHVMYGGLLIVLDPRCMSRTVRDQAVLAGGIQPSPSARQGMLQVAGGLHTIPRRCL